MDFTFTEEQLAVREAADGLFAGLVTPEGVAAVEASEERVDRALWRALADADLLALPVPASLGGGGLGLSEVCLLLEAQGACVAPIPLWATLLLGVLPVARFGTPEQGRRLLPAVAVGDAFLSAALSGATAGTGTRLPVGAEPGPGDGWVLTGSELAVPQAHLATRIVVPAATPGGRVLLTLVDPQGTGARLEHAETTNREVHPHLHLEGAPVAAGEVLAGPERGAEALEWLRQVAWTGLCALQVGVCEAALRQTAAYLNQRQQFGRPLSTFQGTMLRAADAAIDIEAMRVTLWQAAWRLDSGRDAAEAVAVAKWQAAERGQRAVHATQHLHGGMGADVRYPIHRYFLWGKQIELQLGGPSVQLARLGRLIADRFVAGVAPPGAA